jgi:hypothetical protein
MAVELAPVKAMLDQTHPALPTQCDQNNYTLGEVEGHNVVIAVLLEIGTNPAATVVIQPPWPSSVCRHFPVLASQSRTVSS